MSHVTLEHNARLMGFTSHILENRIAIDIGLLCYLMDYLCVSMIFAFRLHKFREPLHDVTLPKSWLLRNISRYDSLRSRTIELSWSYLRNMGALLEQIYSGVNASTPLTQFAMVSRYPHRSCQATSSTKTAIYPT